MRHAIIRGTAAVIWAAIGIVTVNPFFLLVSAVFLFSSLDLWRKERR